MSLLRKTALTFLLFFGMSLIAAHAQNAPAATPAPASGAAKNATPEKTPPALPPMPSKQPYGFANAPADGFDIMSNPVIADSLSQGGKAYYIGNRAGLDGWVLMQGNEVQLVYMPADRKTIIIGNLFASEGYNISADQIRVLLKNNPAVEAAMTATTKEQLGISNNTNPELTQPDGMPKAVTLNELGKSHGGGEANAAASVSQILDMAQDPKNREAAPTIPPGERLLLDLQDARGVDVGDSQAPLLYMIMDPNCPHCQATWRLLRDAVLKKAIRIRLIPIGMNDEDERASAQLLRSKDPLDAWDKYVAGDKSQLAGTADPKIINDVRSNHAMVDSWSITETPYMAYRSAKSGEMKIIAGEPAHADSLVSDVGQ
jgi:thiol:disulfide interchange protein DsbG